VSRLNHCRISGPWLSIEATFSSSVITVRLRKNWRQHRMMSTTTSVREVREPANCVPRTLAPLKSWQGEACNYNNCVQMWRQLDHLLQISLAENRDVSSANGPGPSGARDSATAGVGVEAEVHGYLDS
jgi:hypothetical protein